MTYLNTIVSFQPRFTLPIIALQGRQHHQHDDPGRRDGGAEKLGAQRGPHGKGG